MQDFNSLKSKRNIEKQGRKERKLRCTTVEERKQECYAPAEVLERLFDGELAVERQLLRHVAHVGAGDQGLSEQGTVRTYLVQQANHKATIFPDYNFWAICIKVRQPYKWDK
jgi:hypothetical protein